MEKASRQLGQVPDWVLIITQLLAYVLSAMPLRWYFRVNRRVSSNLHSLRPGALLVANHQSEADPFLLLACLPFRDFCRILPVRFPTTEEVFNRPLYNPRFFPIIWLLGCFSIGDDPTARMKSIFYIRELLAQKRTILIFPEGKISKELNVLDFKKGIDFFMQNTHSLLLVRLQGVGRVERAAGKPCVVAFGDVMSPPPTLSAEDIRAHLTALVS